jgi:uroporphyrinogen-III synthase
MATTSSTNLQGLRIVSFESRRSKEMAELIRRYGGKPIIAPSMRELPLEENRAPLELFRRLEGGEIDIVILLTGVGTRTMIDAVAPDYTRERMAELLAGIITVARGPKPVAVLKELGLRPAITAPEPNTWRDVLGELAANVSLQGKRVAIQEYGVVNQELLSGLEQCGAKVFRVPVYRWALPENTEPLRSAISQLCSGAADVVIFTSATQVEHVFKVAQQNGVENELRESSARMLVVSIGPVCNEALQRYGLSADLEPAHPKMGYLISELSQDAKELLAQKRALPRINHKERIEHKNCSM